ncbi:MAG: XRE family transcriptional regulator [Deltaproteobacteria bacterium HGW-Deltaproteobacteria-23]|nr:MAG: XRE family transcriptional regulator [Deltaproteobacteria bacterium HGW-Deltaproteobacteria-23]
MSRKTLSVAGIGQSESKELALVGEYIKIARKRRGLSLRDFSVRMMVSVPTLISLENGSPSVGIGIFFRALAVLGLEKKIAVILAPENDEAGMGIEIRRVKAIGVRKNSLTETDLDF